jgi:phosphatidate cytidylyltransferase
MPNMAITTLGVVWIGFLGSFAALILRYSKGSGFPVASGIVSTSIGTDTLCLIAIGVVANDVGALVLGSAAGKSPLRAWISPNKSIEGLFGGTVATIVAMLIVSFRDVSTTWNSAGDLILLAIVISIMAPLGDLTESMFKRNLDIKDFGTIVRGHGGVLDRFDGFLFTLPAVYYLLQVLQPWVTK